MGDGSGPVCDDKIGAGKVPELLLAPPKQQRQENVSMSSTKEKDTRFENTYL